MKNQNEDMDNVDMDELDGRPRRREKTKKKMMLKKSGDHKVIVEVNELDVLAGKGWTELSNYLRVIVRDHVPIVYHDCRRVPLKLKNDMLTHIQDLFVLPTNSEKHILQTMGAAHKNFRCTLYTEFIAQHMDEPEKLSLPPKEYKHIGTDEWRIFVKRCFTVEFQEKSKKACENRKKNIYNHRLGSTGYGGLLLKKKEQLGSNVNDIDRADTWLLGRERKDGGYDPEVLEVAEEIKELKNKVKEGSFVPRGDDDVLSVALQKKPNGSRVQGLGHFITPTRYFYMPKATKTEKDKVQDVCDRRYEMMLQKFSEMKDHVSNAFSEIGSCSNANKSQKRKVGDDVEQSILSPLKERCSAPRKSPRLKLKHAEMEGNNEQPKGESHGMQKTVGEVEKPVFTHRKKLFGSVPRNSPQHINTDTLGQANAHSHDMDMNEEEYQSIANMENDRVEGKQKQGCEVVFVKEIRTGMKAKSQLNVQRMTRSVAENRKEQSANMMMFCILVENCLGEMNSIKQDAENFGFQTKTMFNKEVCRSVINFQQVSNSVVEIWARYLHEKMEADGGDMPVQFGTPAAIAIPKRASHQAVTRRSQYIADLLDISLLGQMTLIPYNTGNHWVLVAIDMAAETIYYLDSLGGIPSKDLEEIMNQGVMINHAQKSKKRLNLKWVRVMCPKQTGGVECGYFVMKYMKDIVSDVNRLKQNILIAQA